ncbi:MAG: sigma 54-interacting transcriptional regulator [Bacteroidia bacterium]
MQKDQIQGIRTLEALKASGYKPRPVKEEMRENLVAKLKNKEKIFPGIIGYEETVIPDIQRAILSRHDINLLGLRGQAKTRIARQLISLLDEYLPVVEGSELNDNPFAPLSRYAVDLVAEKGDKTPIAWIHRNERYTEKLATPDVSVADLIGDLDPIKAASMKLSYADERVIHFGLIPRANRGIFAINELPDLQPRIQVALFNILQEGDIQIRGFKLRMPLDLMFVFTANPEDYTNRGSIVTPLKDRIDSQILTHYPASIDVSRQITRQEARISDETKKRVQIFEPTEDLVEEIAFQARESEYVDSKSGVSARLTISAYENLLSAAEYRMLLNNEKEDFVRMADFMGVIPSITGKIELVYEGEQEGPANVAQLLIGKAIRKQFINYFPDPDKFKRSELNNPYQKIVSWFGKGNIVDIPGNIGKMEYYKKLDDVPGLRKLVARSVPGLTHEKTYFFMEFALHGLAEYSLLGKEFLKGNTAFKDLISGMFNFEEGEE